jgi:adenylate kinase
LLFFIYFLAFFADGIFWEGSRGYTEEKLQENLDSEIMQVLLEEAREAYDEEIVVELKSDELEDVEGNVERMEKWVESWKEEISSKGGV